MKLPKMILKPCTLLFFAGMFARRTECFEGGHGHLNLLIFIVFLDVFWSSQTDRALVIQNWNQPTSKKSPT